MTWNMTGFPYNVAEEIPGKNMEFREFNISCVYDTGYLVRFKIINISVS